MDINFSTYGFLDDILALNEDIELAYEILADIVKNSSLEMFEKEVFKLNGEIEAELDNPKTKLLEDYFKNLYEGHYYGNTYLRIIEDIDKITIEDIKEAYSNLLNNSQKCFVVCGDCGEISCVGESMQCKCPWCGMEGYLGEGSSEGMDVNRTRG